VKEAASGPPLFLPAGAPTSKRGLLEELRARTGVLLAASSLAASFLGQHAFQNPSPRALAIMALVAFVVSIGASVSIWMPKENLYFSEAGAGLYEVQLDRFWDSNDGDISKLTRTYKVAAGALVIEILSLAILLGDNIF
jgi:preprotein translocase subunit Sec61beta